MKDYKFSKYLYKPKRKKRKLYLFSFMIFILIGGLLYSILFFDIYSIYYKVLNFYRVQFNDFSVIEKNLESGNYNVVINEGIPLLEKKPYNSKLLRYLGEAYYYISTNLSGKENEELVNKSIFYLRKGIVLSRLDDVLAKSYYVLGAAYFKKGVQYYELAQEYLIKALDSGYNDSSIYEIIGYSFYKLKIYDEAISYLKKALKISQKDVTRLFLAYSYKNSSKFKSAVGELDYLIRNSKDDAIIEESYSALAWIDFQEERYNDARKYLQKLLELNERSAFAHFWLGNIFEKEGNLLSARNEWRLTLKIDPKHIGAIEKLY